VEDSLVGERERERAVRQQKRRSNVETRGQRRQTQGGQREPMRRIGRRPPARMNLAEIWEEAPTRGDTGCPEEFGGIKTAQESRSAQRRDQRMARGLWLRDRFGDTNRSACSCSARRQRLSHPSARVFVSAYSALGSATEVFGVNPTRSMSILATKSSCSFCLEF